MLVVRGLSECERGLRRGGSRVAAGEVVDILEWSEGEAGDAGEAEEDDSVAEMSISGVASDGVGVVLIPTMRISQNASCMQPADKYS